MTDNKTTASQLPGEDLETHTDGPGRRDQGTETPGAEEQAPAEGETPRHEGDAPREAAAKIQGNDTLLRLYRAGQTAVPAEDGDTGLREFHVKRDDHLPLKFTGYLVGSNEVDPSVPRGTRVSIFTTRGGKIITSVHQWQRDESRERERHAAAVHTNPDAALAWLIKDGGNQLGRASREAWELACRVWPALQGHEVEVVD